MPHIGEGRRNLLWGVVGRKVGQAQGFQCSDAMKNHGGEWTWEQLARYLHDPKGAVPGNKMALPASRTIPSLPICSPICAPYRMRPLRCPKA
jgi:hypothetical protein